MLLVFYLTSLLLDLSINQYLKKCLYLSDKCKENSCLVLAYLNFTHLDLKISEDKHALLTINCIRSN